MRIAATVLKKTSVRRNIKYRQHITNKCVCEIYSEAG